MGILFDLDGTLLDTAPDFLFAINELREEEQLTAVSLNEIRSFVSQGLSRLITVAFGYDKDHPKHQRYCESLLAKYSKNLGQHTLFFPGILQLLCLLEERRIPWGIVTNKTRHLTDPLLQRLGLFERAACIVSGDTTPNFKPHPDPLLHAARLLNLPAHHCLFIGDAEVDILAGKNAGMKTIGALFGYINTIEEALQWGADHYVSHPTEIWPWLENNHFNEN